MGRNLLHFGLLLWKNFTLQKRRPISTVVEIGMPTFFIVILVVVRMLTEHNNKIKCGVDGGCFYDPVDWHTVYSMINCPNGFLIGFTGANLTLAATLLGNVTNPNLFFNMATMVPYTSEATLLNGMMNTTAIEYYGGGCRAAIVFQEMNTTTNQFAYDIRYDYTPGGYDQKNKDQNAQDWWTGNAFPFFQGYGPRDDSLTDSTSFDFGGSPGYYQYSFLMLEVLVNLGITNFVSPQNTTSIEEIYDNMRFNRIPYREYKSDPFVYAIEFGLPLLLMLSLLYTALSIVKSIVYEKEKRLKESMKMMGLKNWVQWAAWYTQYFFFLMLTMLIIIVLIAGGKVLQNSDKSLVFVYLMFFAMASISFCFLISTFFSKASTGAAAGGILWFCSYIPYFFIQQNYSDLSVSTKTSSCFLSTVAMALGANLIGQAEARGDGIQWDNAFKPFSVDDPFNFGIVLGMLLYDTVLYLILAWYIEAVFPGDFGIPQPFYFPFTKTYWFGPSKKNANEFKPLLDNEDSGHDPASFEREPDNIRAGIAIRHLRKVFGPKVAVKDTTLNMYEGQITALLGHNGAGKTTTMSMLTGLYPPTSGDAVIDGFNITEDIGGAQSAMGLCPQHDVLFDALTVEEHLWFFCKLKGISDTAEHIVTMAHDLMLTDKLKSASSTLSGGMKRKLSCGIALVGGSKIVILDEPTSGMDPQARRATWDLLVKYKQGRTVLLSTHFMDEADILGDRIAIMSNGTVKCCGSPLFLKSKYGIGYHLTMVKTESCNADAVTAFLTKFVSTRIESNVGAELTYLLPRSASSQFERMFSDLENAKESLGIESYGISVTTMEEVFLKVGEDDDTHTKIDIQARIDGRSVNGSHQNQPVTKSYGTYNNGASSSDTDHLLPSSRKNGSSRNQGADLKIQQFKAMLIKRFLHSTRNKTSILSQLALPLFFTIIALVIARAYPGPEDSPPRGLNSLVGTYKANTLWYTDKVNGSLPNSPLSAGLASAMLNVSDLASPLQSFKYLPDGDWSDLPHYMVAHIGPNPDDIAQFNKVNLIALSFIPNGASVDTIAYFNGQAYHSIVQAITLFSNTILEYYSPHAHISVRNYPLPRTLAEMAKSDVQSGLGFTIAFNILFGMAFLTSSFVLFLVAERSSKAKHVQFVSGVDALSYWVATYLSDYLNFLVPTIGIIFVILGFSVDNFEGERLGYVMVLFLSYGFSILPLMYLFSFLFMVPSVAYTRLTMFNIVTGLAAMLTISILLQIEPSYATNAKVGFLFLPNYCFGQGLSDLYTNYQAVTLAKSMCNGAWETCCHLPEIVDNLGFACTSSYMSWSAPGLGRYVTFMVLEGVVFFILVILVELRVLEKFREKCLPAWFPSGSHYELQEDDDIRRERERVAAMMANPEAEGTDLVLLNDLTKVYRTGTFGLGPTKLAVDHISLGIPEGECFGLLGVNGAGKTTTFKMITGDESISSGEVLVDGYSNVTDMEHVRQRMGYCPQFDALIDLMTGRELLRMYGRLRGVPEDILEETVSNLIYGLMLEKHADKYCGTYSGGNKRKLSTAIALVGDPVLVLLDEPTSGMDPGARRFLWDALMRVRQEGRCIVLTSHSMEECEALCTRLVIMVNGKFMCLGSAQHLKSKYGRGFSVIFKVKEQEHGVSLSAAARQEEVERVKRFISEHYPENAIQDEHQGMVSYKIYGHHTWASLFSTLERAKADLGLEDYSISQTTLEQIFLGFAKHQIEDPLQQP